MLTIHTGRLLLDVHVLADGRALVARQRACGLAKARAIVAIDDMAFDVNVYDPLGQIRAATDMDTILALLMEATLLRLASPHIDAAERVALSRFRGRLLDDESAYRADDGSDPDLRTYSDSIAAA
jgi:hypothetical protein